MRLIFSAGAAVAAILSVHGLASAFVVLNIVLDRFCLYAGTVEVTPAVEIGVLKAERMEEAAL